MVEERLKSRINRFVYSRGGIYIKVENVSLDTENRVIQQYVPQAIARSYELKSEILDHLIESLEVNQNHNLLPKWATATVGIAKYLLLPTEMTEVEPDYAADVVVRLSRWFHARPINLFKALIPAPRRVVFLLWNDIEDLYPRQ